MVRSTEVMDHHCRRNREYPSSFSSALLEEISRSTESCTVEDEKINLRRREMKFSRDSSLGVPACKEPPHAEDAGQGQRGIEIGILKYFHGYVDHNRAHNDEADKKKKKNQNQNHHLDLDRKQVLAMQYSNADPSSRRSISSSDAEPADVSVCRRDCKWQWQWQSSVARHGSRHGNNNSTAASASASSSSHGLVMRDAVVEQTRTSKVKETPKLQAMSPGRRVANFLNSLFTLAKRKSKRVTAHQDHRSGSVKSPSEKVDKHAGEKVKTAARPQCNSVSVCSVSSVTSNCTSTASTTPNSNSSSWLLHHCDIYKPNLICNVRKSEHAMNRKRYEEFSLINQASSCHDPKQLKSSFVNNNRSPQKGIRRSVKFYPTSTAILDEYGRSCREKDLKRVENHNKHSLPFPSKNLRRVQLSEKGVIPSEYLIYHDQDRKYSKKLVETRVEDENGDDSGSSDSSSDLFELRSLNAVNMDIYSRELPVYETTNLETNRAIAKGLL